MADLLHLLNELAARNVEYSLVPSHFGPQFALEVGSVEPTLPIVQTAGAFSGGGVFGQGASASK